MTKIFKQLGRHWAACLAVVALLVVQAAVAFTTLRKMKRCIFWVLI